MLSSVAPCRAATYYIDAALGNDVNSGQSVSEPWKSVSRVNVLSLNPGDTVLFNRGQVWREKLDVPSSGASGNPIVFGAFGQGSLPLFLGSRNYDSPDMWKPEGSPHCWTTADNTFTYLVGQVYFNTDSNTLSAGRAGPGTTFPRFASIGAMSANQDFFWDQARNRLVVYHPEGNPAISSNGLEITCQDTASDGRVELSGKSHITIQDLAVKYTNSHAILIHDNSSNVTVTNCNLSYFGGIGQTARLGNGIDIQNAHDISVTNCTVDQGMDEGITLEAVRANDEIYNIAISDNTVSRCGSVGIDVIILRESTSGARIHDVIISNNTVYDIGKGWSGVSPNAYWCPSISLSNAYTTGSKSLYDISVSGNNLYGSHKAGLYVKRTNENVEITKNRIHDHAAQGIYIEEGATNCRVAYNLIYKNMRSGIGTAAGANGNLNIFNNIFYNNGNASYAGVRVEPTGTAVLKNNIFYSDTLAPGGAAYLLSISSNAGVVTLHNNCYYGTSPQILSWKGSNFSLQQFDNYKAAAGQDALSIAADPGFNNALQEDFSIKKDSVCLDAGMPVGLDRDFKGTAVPQKNQVDIGAFEIKVLAAPKNVRCVNCD